MRYAVYFAPAPASPLGTFGRQWLGRDAETGAAVTTPALHDVAAERLAAWTAAPRRYGFHATLKPPFRLAEECAEADLVAAIAAFAAARGPVALPRLALADLDGFLALTTPAPVPELHALADACVAAFDGFRRPPPPEETAKRRAAGLTARQEALLARWGYPFVMEEYRFHLTLTERLPPPDGILCARHLQPLLAPVLAAPATVDALALFVEPAPGAPFRLRARFALAAAGPADAIPAGPCRHASR